MGGEEYNNEKPLQRFVSSTRNVALVQVPLYNSVTKKGGAMGKAENKRDTNSLVGFVPMQKGAFEHEITCAPREGNIVDSTNRQVVDPSQQ